MATRTGRIRIGSAGVMLPHYSAFKVVEQFRVLDALAPGRIDLGLGRAPGSDGRTAFALNPLANERPAQFPADIRDLRAWLNGDPLPDDHPFRTLAAFPQGDTAPEIWILGSSNYGAQVAAYFGLPYSFAWFFHRRTGAPSRRSRSTGSTTGRAHPIPCRTRASASGRWRRDSEEEARFHFSSRLKWRLYRDRGLFLPLEPAGKAASHPYTEAEEARLARFRKDAIIGTGEQVARRIAALGGELGVDEIAIITWTHDEEVRRRSYTLIAEAFGLGPRPTQ